MLARRRGAPRVRRFDFHSATAVVTGAASGIGAALAHGLAARGSDLVLLDRDAERLATVVGMIRAAYPGRRVDPVVVDLADAAATAGAAEQVRVRHPRIRLLVNNAGVALGGRFDQVTLDEFQWVVDINFRAVVQLTHALLPALKAETGSHLVNVSSLFGLIAPPGQAAYSATKFAVRGFTEALRHELVADGVGVTSVHPGGIATRITENARIGSGVNRDDYEVGRRRFDRLLSIPPARAAEVILRGVERRRPRVLIGLSAKLPDVIARIAPSAYGRLLRVGLNQTADAPTRRLTTGAASSPQPADEPPPAASPTHRAEDAV
ncbi:short-chain dehydrogenase/reductase SDR [Salinispora tropica CNB-440]|uniref:Short-chain dehydrogenase/reductase SDR n=1 Tax=Salinispora tropica (strain ATCC BAA-916 / DSM 44818 / JCM 13857 / NBRC 105044 / CNB-440) TaxID=369723 RepID=A4X7J3_SALTO|nr:short-chain dehydrogenase/reductase SDR [Salinispora tropica CNB-440]